MAEQTHLFKNQMTSSLSVINLLLRLKKIILSKKKNKDHTNLTKQKSTEDTKIDYNKNTFLSTLPLISSILTRYLLNLSPNKPISLNKIPKFIIAPKK